jgi:hypothetical protein
MAWPISFACLALIAAAVPVAADDPYAIFGPLKDMIGIWFGVRGGTAAPDKPGELQCYFEQQEFRPIFPVVNKLAAETVVALSYVVKITKPDGTPFHEETGQWFWLADSQTVVRAGTVPRGQMFMAGGSVSNASGFTVLSVMAMEGDERWGLLNTPETKANLPTTMIVSDYHINANRLWYNDTSTLKVNGHLFNHSTANCLARNELPLRGDGTWAECPDLPIFCKPPSQR